MKSNSEYFELLDKYIPGGSSTGSKRAHLLPEEPAVIERARGCRVWDADGREFIDFRNSLGPVTLGYCYSEINEAIRDQLEKGYVYGHPGVLEAEAAEVLCGVIPSAEKIRFLKTGGEAVAACIKLSRAYTGKRHVIQIGYNGWLNTLSTGARLNPRDAAKGVPKGIPEDLSSLHHTVGWDDKKAIRELFYNYSNDIASVVVAADYEEMDKGRGFYLFLREICDANESVLVFDEIVTGFRISTGGVQEYFGVMPDLSVFAKGMANGMPLSCFCGRADIMDEISKGASISSTYGGEQLSLAAAIKVVEIYRREDVPGYLMEKGEYLWSNVNDIFREKGIGLLYKGFGTCPKLVENESGLCDRFFRAAYTEGVSLYNVSYINFSHKDRDIAEVLSKLRAAIGGL